MFSEAHRSARDKLTTKVEIEAAKLLAKARIDMDGKKRKKKEMGGCTANNSEEPSE